MAWASWAWATRMTANLAAVTRWTPAPQPSSGCRRAWDGLPVLRPVCGQLTGSVETLIGWLGPAEAKVSTA